jgi:hypothetical protein
VSGPLRFEPDPAAAGRSTNDYVAGLPKRRWSHEAKGRLLFMPRTGMVLTPCKMHGDSSWDCVVTVGTATYPTDGYSLWVGRDEIESAIDLTRLLTDGLGGICQDALDAEAAEHAAARTRSAAGPFAKVLKRIAEGS